MFLRLNFIKFKVIALLLIAICTVTVAQPQSEALDRSLLGQWVVEGPTWIQLLKIKSVTKGSDGSYAVNASYANTAAKVVAESADEKTKLQVTTSAGSVIALNSSDATTFAGTFTNSSGAVPVKMTKVASAQSSSDPSACGKMEGVWEGKWSVGNIGVWTLWIRDVSTECTASVAYGIVRERISIANGKFSFLCNPSTNGTCNFTRVGSDLWAGYSNPSGGSNNAVFRKIE